MSRLTQNADFQRVLARAPCAKSPHFALHHLAVLPHCPQAPTKPVPEKLSTALPSSGAAAVDDLGPAADLVTRQLWLGVVIPKRHAKRSVTRNLLKRQMRCAVFDMADLPGGLWVLRLRAPFTRDRYVSAASVHLARDARAELEAMLRQAVARRPQP